MVFLLLGAVINVAVAWAYAFRARGIPAESTWMMSDDPLGSPYWACDFTSEQWPNTVRFFVYHQFDREGPMGDWWMLEQIVPAWAGFIQPPDDYDEKTRIAQGSGWPFLSVCGGITIDYQSNSQGANGHWVILQRNAATLMPDFSGGSSPSVRDTPLLPLRPIWPGFAINTVFYSAILWMLFAAPRALRRKRRLKHGLCPACAYPIGSSHVCTECGAAVKPNRSSANRIDDGS